MPILSYKTISYLSIDVALGAIISSAFIAEVFNTHVHLITYLVLGLVVWSIYTFDHLLDARASDGQLLERHAFHRKWFIPISGVLILALLSIVVFLFFLPIEIIYLGTALGIFVIIYFISIHFLPWQKVYHKEILAALVYFLGTIIGPLATLESKFDLSHAVILITYFLIVLLNLFIFSGFDKKADVANNFPSIYRVLKKRELQTVIIIISIAVIFLSYFVNNIFGGHISLLLIAMLFVLDLTYIFSKHPRMAKINRYLGDGIFLLPSIYFL